MTPQPLSGPIVCFNANPAVERTCVLDHFTLGAVHRIPGYLLSASGKAATVARTISNLGVDTLQVGPLAGGVGHEFVDLLNAEGMEGQWVWVDGQTRTNVTIVSGDSTHDTIINETGPELSAKNWRDLTEVIDSLCQPGVPLCISGSIPRGVSADNLTQLVTTLGARGVPVVVDSSGWALDAMLSGIPWCAKFNHLEAGGLLHRDLTTVDDVAAAARELLPRVGELVIITMGERGAVMASHHGQLVHLIPPKVDAVSGVGSGDTFLGALLVGVFSLGLSSIDACALATAAGAVNATMTQQGHVTMEQLVAIRDDVTISELTVDEHGV